MKKICVLTSIRAEYGLLKPLLKKIEEDNSLELVLIVAGAHLSEVHGNTVKEIEKDGFAIADQISYLTSGQAKADRAKEIGLLAIQLANSFQRLSPDLLILLGDRYESLGAAMVAMTMNIPIYHIAGGERTEGLIDEQVRHAITKIAHIHLAEAEVYAKNIEKMGEESWRVFNVGALGIENIKTIQYLTQEQLAETLGITVDEETLLITYHSVTLEGEQLEWQIEQLLNALRKINKKMIITYPNVDQGGNYIIHRLQRFAKENKNVCLVDNLGVQRYLSVMKLCGAVVGNSSSALIEAPYLKKPVVNIGNRQKGRLMATNIISCSNDERDIVASIQKALSKEFKEQCNKTKSLYGDGETSTEIIEIIKKIAVDEKLIKKKLVWGE